MEVDVVQEQAKQGNSFIFYGGRGGDRTHNPRLRRPVLYPIELLAQRLNDLREFPPNLSTGYLEEEYATPL